MSANLEVRRSHIRGLGCFALALFAGELVRGGRRIEARLRVQEAVKVIWLTDGLAIDGPVGEDETAYVDHSCEPNAYMRMVPGDKVPFFAPRDIRPGEEITVDYRSLDFPDVCRCGAEG